MKIKAEGDTLQISGMNELGSSNAPWFRDQVRKALGDQERNIEIDFSQVVFLDSSGLGALIALHKTALSRNGRLRLLNPAPQARQILELTRMNRVFEIIGNKADAPTF